MKTTTLKQIAETLNLSIATVSKALKDYPDVSKSTREKVRDLAKELQYTPNNSAVTLRTKQSKIIGVIIPTLVHHFFSNILKGVIREAENKGYLVITLQSNESFELEKKQVDLLISKGVDGILISLSNLTNKYHHLKKIQEHNIPVVLFDKISKSFKCSKVVIDDRAAAYEAVMHLLEKGHERIAHFRGGLNPQNSIDRFLGYKKALNDNGIPFDLETEQIRLFKSLLYTQSENGDETWYFNDGSIKGLKIVTFNFKFPDVSSRDISIGFDYISHI